MQFIYPIGFLALAGLIIPVLIHLWSTKNGKTLKIGSIALLGESATASARSFKLTDLLLFALRCLILMLIALLLTMPYFKKTNVASKNKGWILMKKEKFSEAYREHSKTIDSLEKMGFELHDFNLGFEQFSPKDSIFKAEAGTSISYNALLNQLNQQIPLGYTAYLFADRRLTNFDGNWSKSNNLIWKDVTNRDTLKQWETTFLQKIYTGESTPNLTRYSSNPSQNLPLIQVMITEFKGMDEKYIRAALSTISDFTHRKITIINSVSDANLIFWLSDQAFDSSVLKNMKAGARLITYVKGREENINSTLRIVPNTTQIIALKKRIGYDGRRGTIVWTDGYGDPILIKEAGRVDQFHFYSRFNPQWTDLVWEEQFVRSLMPIVLGNQSEADFGFENHADDQRLVAHTQFFAPQHSKSDFTTTTINQSMEYVIWIITLILLMIERIYSFRHKNLGYVKN